jgi:hypothetical protein
VRELHAAKEYEGMRLERRTHKVPQGPQNPRGNAVNIWYTITVEKMMQSDARKTSGFDRDILEWNIPKGVVFVLCQEEFWGL